MEEPKLSLQVLREAIPEHCFQPSLKKSLLYLARDFLYAGSLVYLATYLSSSSFDVLTICGWALYSILQGFVGTGLWILAHECGHGAFSNYGWVNDTVGWIVHSLLLVPYFSWKYSHARHHRFTSHMTKDTAFVPPTKAEVQASKGTALGLWRQATEDMPLAILFTFLAHQLLGWPAYLLSYISAGEENGTSNIFKSHFDPWSGIFTAKQQPFVALSDLGLAIVCASLYYLATQLSFLHVVLLYVLPYLWVNHWIGMKSHHSPLRQSLMKQWNQWQSPIFTTHILKFHITGKTNGRFFVGLSPPWIGISGSLVAISSTRSSIITRFITYSHESLSTMQKKPLRPYDRFWDLPTMRPKRNPSFLL